MAHTELLLHFDELADPIVYTDSSPTPKTLTPLPVDDKPLQQGTIAKFTGAVLLDGTSQFIEVTNDASLQLAGDFTIECWVYITNYTTSSVAWNHSIDVDNRYVFFATASTGTMRFQLKKLGVLEMDLIGAQIPLNEWHHIALTRNGSTTRIYLDGVIQDTDTSGVAFDVYTSDPCIGKYEFTTNYFAGYIDEFRLSQVARYGGSDFTPQTLPFGTTETTLYCTVADVISVAQMYENDYNDNSNLGEGANSTLKDSDITPIILDAMIWVDNVFETRWDVDAIKALDPDYPPIVVNMTKLRSAIILFNRDALLDADRQKVAVKEMLETELNNLIYVVTNGILKDVNGDMINPVAGARLQTQEIYADIGDHYDNGHRNY